MGINQLKLQLAKKFKMNNLDIPRFLKSDRLLSIVVHKSVIQIFHNLVFQDNTKNIEINCHLNSNHLKYGTITLTSLLIDKLSILHINALRV